MKSNELMLGDWVDSPYGNIKVECIYNNGYEDVVGEHEEMHLDWDTGEEEPWMKDITIDMVEPISLTEEMLLKNGFVFDEFDSSFSIWNNEGSRIALYKKSNSNEFWLDGYYGSITFTYVHEVQHLLRMCGLKEISDNFKVD